MTTFTLLGFPIAWYGVFLVLATMFGLLIAYGVARWRKLSATFIWYAAPFIILAGFTGARLWFVLFPPQSVVALGRTASWMLAHFFDINQGAIAIWIGGLGWWGALSGGLLGLWLATERADQPMRPWLDVAALTLPIAHSIGRLANGLTQELYGPPTLLPWGTLIDNPIQRVAPYTDLTRYPLTTHFHPIWLYEALWLACIALILWTMAIRRTDQLIPTRLRTGHLFLWYLALYGLGRAGLESWRVNGSWITLPIVGAFNISQWTAIFISLWAWIMLWRTRYTSLLGNTKPAPISQSDN